MAEHGLTEADYPDVIVDIWPENLQALELYFALSSQWRGGNIIALDYSAIPAVMELTDFPACKRQRRLAFDAIRTLEGLEAKRIQARRKAQEGKK